jgi:hypothetical protein
MESFEKRKRERKKQEVRKEKAARKLQGLESQGPTEADYFADPIQASDAHAAAMDEAQGSADRQDANTPPAIDGGVSAG